MLSILTGVPFGGCDNTTSSDQSSLSSSKEVNAVSDTYSTQEQSIELTISISSDKIVTMNRLIDDLKEYSKLNDENSFATINGVNIPKDAAAFFEKYNEGINEYIWFISPYDDN